MIPKRKRDFEAGHYYVRRNGTDPTDPEVWFIAEIVWCAHRWDAFTAGSEEPLPLRELAQAIGPIPSMGNSLVRNYELRFWYREAQG